METQLLISSYDIYTTYQVLKNRATDAADEDNMIEYNNIITQHLILGTL